MKHILKKRIAERLGPYSKVELFDSAFWKKQDIDSKWLALWSMIEDYYSLKYGHKHKLRLQRSVQNIKQI